MAARTKPSKPHPVRGATTAPQGPGTQDEHGGPGTPGGTPEYTGVLPGTHKDPGVHWGNLKTAFELI